MSRLSLGFARRQALARLGVWATLLLASGCPTSLREWTHNRFKVGPNYVRPPAPVSQAYLDSDKPGITVDPVQDCAWWTVFNDPTLNGLIETAYRQNLDLRAAGTRIAEARAQRAIAVGNLFPQSQTAMAAYAHGQVTENLQIPFPPAVNVWATGFNASWELDFWGRYRRSVEGANAQWAASVEDYGDGLVMLFAEVATTYVQMRTFEERLDFARQNEKIQEGSLKLSDDRFREGVSTELDVRQARTNLEQTRSAIPPLEIGRRQAANRLCVLMGMPVTDLAADLPAAPIPKPPMELAVGVPADLLRRRPDVRRAERQVAAQSAQIGVAEADLYPRLSVGGFLGYAADDIERLLESKSFTAFVIPQVQWNVLNYGRIVNNIAAQDARLEGTALAYQQSVLNAGREVEDALVGFLQSQQQAARLEQSVRDAERSVELVLVQFKAGVSDFNRVFNTQAVLVTQQDQLALARGQIALNLIQAYKAMGGGWQHFFAGRGLPPMQVVHDAPAQQQQVPQEPVPAPAPMQPAAPPQPPAGADPREQPEA